MQRGRQIEFHLLKLHLNTALNEYTMPSDDVASRLQVSDLYKSDLQVSSRFANDLM